MYQPQAGDYGCVQTNGIVGFLIQLGTLTKYNHAFIYLGDGEIIEATPRHGVIISPVTNYKNIAWNMHEPKTDEQREALVVQALTHLGDRYSFLAFLAIAMRILHVRSPKWLCVHLDKSKNEICSELVARDYRACEFAVEGQRPDYYISPSDLIYRLLYI